MPKKDPELCQKIRDRVDKWEKYWTINRSLYYEWIEFVLGDQWTEDESKLFERYNKIPLSFNKLGVLHNHMQGEMIRNTPNLQISPEDDVPVEAADVRAALVKNISLNSDAKSIYQGAYSQATIGGFSAFRLDTDYLHDMSFDQEIRIHGFDDPNHCYWDMSAKHPCKVDGMYAGFRTRMSRQQFRDKWGKDVESQIGSSAITEDSTVAFADDDSITQVDDFERIGEKVTIYQLSNGNIVDSDGYAKLEKVKVDKKRYLMQNGEMVTVFQKRDTVKYTIKRRQIAGDFVLDETDFPSEWLPIIYVDQKSYYTKQGQQITRSFFKDVKDAQKYLNYLATQSAYIMKVSRYDQFIAPRKCIAAPDTQQIWRDPSVVRGALWYDETPSGEKPEQLRPPELSQSLTLEYERTLVDIQSGTGLFNAQMGDVDGDESGRAINAGSKRGAQNTQLPRKSIDKAVATSGEIINQMIPHVYDNERTLMLAMPQSESQPVTINKMADPYGMSIENNMKEGRYKIRLKPGASYEGQKEEALESLQLVLQADKGGQVFPLIADLYAENLPLDNSLELRNRLRTLVPQEIIEAGKTGKPLPPKPPQPSPDEILAQLKQAELQQKEEQAKRDYQLKLKDIERKQQEMQLKAIQGTQEMEMQWQKIEAEKEEAAAELQETILRYRGEQERIGADLQMNHAENLIKLLTHASKLHHDREMQDKDHKHESKNRRME